MVAAKGKVQMGINRVTEDSRCHRTDKGVRNFKVYTDNENAKVDVSGIRSVRESLVPARTSVSVNKGALPNTSSDLKEGSKFAEKIKGKSVSSVNQDFNFRRKALADVSNAQSSFSRNVTCDGSKTMIIGCSRSKTVNVSTKCSVGRMNVSQRFGNLQSASKGVKDLSAYSDDWRTHTKNSDRESIVTVNNSRRSTNTKNSGLEYCSLVKRSTNTKNSGRESIVTVNNSRRSTNTNNIGRESIVAVNNNKRSTRGSLISVRKSLPVLTTVNQTDTNNIKNNDEGSGRKTKRNSGFSCKVKTSKNLVPKVSIYRTHLQKNKVNDGTMDQTNVKAHGGSRKLVKPTVKTSISASNPQRTLRTKRTSAMDKSISTVATSTDRKDESVTSSLLDNIPVVVSHEAIQEPSFDSNSKSTANKLDAIVQRKSDRRRSYTSSLMARSKLLVEHGEVIKQEKVPCIDDNCNQLEVAEYVDDIYQFYWVSEVHFKFELMQETLYLMVTLLDQYLSQVQIKKNQMQLVGLTALLLASKYEDFWHPRIQDLLSISAQSYTRDEMLVMEKLILKKLKFRLNAPTPYVFMLRFLKAAQTDLESQLGHLSFYLIELSLVEYEALKFKPSMLCASAIYVARSTLQVDPAWTPLLAKHTRYEVSQIRDCAQMMLEFQKAARKSHLKVTYEKYTSPDLRSVATLKPLDKLPL
uniref:B-like cyclin n=1 Tax=Manihot esculenta TaxID=3983 RepID=A0A2C9U906_MANES